MATRLTARKAKKMLKDDQAQGKPLTGKQKRLFRAVASGKRQRTR